MKRGRIAEATWRRSHNIATIQSRNGDAVKKKKWLDRHDNLCDFLQKVFGGNRRKWLNSPLLHNFNEQTEELSHSGF